MCGRGERELLNNSSPFSSFPPVECCTVDPCNHEIDPLSRGIEGVNVWAEQKRYADRQDMV